MVLGSDLPAGLTILSLANARVLWAYLPAFSHWGKDPGYSCHPLRYSPHHKEESRKYCSMDFAEITRHGSVHNARWVVIPVHFCFLSGSITMIFTDLSHDAKHSGNHWLCQKYREINLFMLANSSLPCCLTLRVNHLILSHLFRFLFL